VDFFRCFQSYAKRRIYQYGRRAYDYICLYLIDQEFAAFIGGRLRGKSFRYQKAGLCDSIHHLCFQRVLPGLGDEAVRQKAVNLFYLLVEKAYDRFKPAILKRLQETGNHGDLRLSAKDANERRR